MRRFAAVAPAGGRSFAAGVCAEGLFSPGFLRRTVLAAGRAVFAATGFRSPAPASVGSRRRFRTGRPPPGLRACRDACSGFDAPRSVHRGPCIGAMPAGSCVGRFASTLPHGTAPPPDFVRAGMRVPDSVPREVRASGRVHRGPCIGAMPAGSCVGRFASTLPHGTAPPPDFVRAGMRVPDSVPREIRESRTVYRRPCGAACVPRTGSEDRLSAASVRRRNAAERTFPFRCGEGSQYDTGDCGDAAHRTGGCPQRSDPVRRRGGAFRGRSDGACRTQRGVDRGRCANSRTAGQKGRRPDSFGKRKNADAARSCAGSEPVRRAGSANVGGGKTDVRLPDRKNGAETNMGPGGWRMVLK